MSATCESELVIEAVRPTGEGWKQRNWLAGSVYIRPEISEVTAAGAETVKQIHTVTTKTTRTKELRLQQIY